jgi:hypothetical protein
MIREILAGHKDHWQNQEPQMRQLRQIYLTRFYDDKSISDTSVRVETSDAYAFIESYIASLFEKSPSVEVDSMTTTSEDVEITRASVNGWANTVLNPIPYSRWSLLNLSRHNWKVQKVRRVLIAPSAVATVAWEGLNSQSWAENLLDKFPGAEIKIRIKAGKAGLRYQDLWDDLDWCDLVVAQSSAITCEAFWYGKKVISLQPCPTWAAGKTTLDNWQDPTEPVHRDLWHEHLAWSQYTVDEWASGEAFDLIQQYLGPVQSYDPQHCYNLPIF